MGKQYITTVNVADAHKLDITGVAITGKYTITISSDGYACYWDNKQDEVHKPEDFVHRDLVKDVGIHHLAVYENIVPLKGGAVRVVLIAFACFDGSVVFKYFVNEDVSTLKVLEVDGLATQFWAPGFYKDPESKQDYFVCTHAAGSTYVFNLNVVAVGEAKVEITIEKFGELSTNISSFPNALSLTTNEEKRAAVGYVNGTVQIYDLQALKVIYTFHSTDLIVSRKEGASNSNSMTRAVRFSPGGSLLAVARDNQSAGSVTLYDVKFGENVGSLTTPSHSTVNTIGGFAHEGWVMGLSFDEEGKFLATCGFDRCVRVWNLESREREATINLSVTDLEDTSGIDYQFDKSIASGVEFIRKGIRGGAGGDTNQGLCVVSFDRAVRWYREAGGI